jgi:hypothetical protein
VGNRRFDRREVQRPGVLGRSDQFGCLEAVGLAVEHQAENHRMGGGKSHVAHALRDEPRRRVGLGPRRFGRHGLDELDEAPPGDFGQQVVDRLEVVRGSCVRNLRPAGAFPQGEAGKALLVEKGATCGDQRLAQVAVVISHAETSTLAASRLRQAYPSVV